MRIESASAPDLAQACVVGDRFGRHVLGDAELRSVTTGRQRDQREDALTPLHDGGRADQTVTDNAGDSPLATPDGLRVRIR
jgi:hypothetical protein